MGKANLARSTALLAALLLAAAVSVQPPVGAESLFLQVNLEKSFNNDGIYAEGESPAGQGFDGGPGAAMVFSYSAEFMPPADKVLTVHTHDGIPVPFMPPNAAFTAKNNLECQGQRLAVPAGSYERCYLLGAAHSGAVKDLPLTFEYEDGAKVEIPISASDWCSAPQFGEVEAVSGASRYLIKPTGAVRHDITARIWLLPEIAIDGGRRLVAVSLPGKETPGSNRLHIFAMTLAAKAPAAIDLAPAVGRLGLTVDAANPGPAINNALFSISGTAALGELGAMARDAFAILRLQGTMARIETLIAKGEPENDDMDPAHYNWDSFKLAAAFRDVDDRDGAFLRGLLESGLEPVLLFNNQAKWLAKDERPGGPPRDPAEYAEFVTAVLTRVNQGSKQPVVKYIEVWNEPNIPQFWTGTREEYFALFNAVARRVHRECPGVMVGGPSYVNVPGSDPVGFMRAFLDKCGENADFFTYHSYLETPEKIVKDVRAWRTEAAARFPGRAPRLMITESDNHALSGTGKMDYLIRRQLALLGVADDLIAFHHFCLLEYGEGTDKFGLIRPDGTVAGQNYWPYWLFRDFRGHLAEARWEGGDAPADAAAKDALQVAASAAADGRSASALVYFRQPIQDFDRGFIEDRAEITVDFKLKPGRRPWAVTVSRVGSEGGEVSGKILEFSIVPPGGRARCKLTIEAGTAMAINVRELDGTETPYLSLVLDRREIMFGESFTAEAEVINTTGARLEGKFILGGLPPAWEVLPVEGSADFAGLEPGARATATYRIKVTGPGRSSREAIYVYAPCRLAGRRELACHSVPADLTAVNPMRVKAWPAEIYGAPGETVTLKAEVTGLPAQEIGGTVSLCLPERWPAPAPAAYAVKPGLTGVLTMPITVPADAKEGPYPLELCLEYKGVVFPFPATLIVKRYERGAAAVTVKLDDYVDVDGISGDDKPGDGTLDGTNCYPAEDFPRAAKVSLLGVDFLMPPLQNGYENMLCAGGEKIKIPEGRYRRLCLLAFAVNGDRKGPLTLGYADGATAQQELKVTDWCEEPRYGEVPILRFTHRHNAGGDIGPAPCIFFLEVPVNAEKVLTMVELPKIPDLYFVAMSLVR
ncbi:MAG: GH39 family glycosyl hydrolase [Bacteroidota bacterium]